MNIKGRLSRIASARRLFAASVLLALQIAGCISRAPIPQTSNSPFGLVYYHSEQREQYDTGVYYYYDIKGDQTWRVSEFDKPIFGLDRSVQWSPANQQFVYVAGLGNGKEIYITDLEGRTHNPLTSNDQEDTMAYWSPNGRKIVFLSRRENGSTQRAYIMNADGSEVQDLLNDPQILADGIMHWSPDNRYVALTGVRIEEQPRFAGQIWPTHIYVVDVESGETIHRLEDGSMHLSVSWSPDGKHLAYTSDLDGKLKIYVWDLDTANQQKVVNLEDVLLVSWSPDGLWLAGIAGPPDEKTHLYVVRPDGSNLTDLTPQMTYVASQGVDMWSPDGKCLSFSATSDQSKTSEIQWDIYVVDIINEKSIKLTDDLNFDAGGIWVSSPDKRESCNLVFQNR